MPNLEEANQNPIMVLHQMAAPSTNLIFQKDKTEFIFPGKKELVFPYNVIFIYILIQKNSYFLIVDLRFLACVFTIMVLHQMAAVAQPANLIL